MFIGMLRFAALAMLAAIFAGCGSSDSDSNIRVANDNSYKVKTYQQDGYMGLTSVNPNNPLNPSYHHYEDDTNLMKAILGQLQGIDKSSITLRGPTARVKIKPKPELSGAQADKLRSQAQLALQSNMPRYNVFVKIDR